MKKALFPPLLLLTIFAMAGGCTPPAVSTRTPAMEPLAKATVPEKEKGSAYYFYMQSEIHKQKKMWDKAIFFLLKAIEIDPDSVHLNQELVVLYLQNKNPSKAIETAEQMVKEHPENVVALSLLGKLKLQLKKNTQAKEIYQQIIHLDPDNRNAYIVLGSLYMEQGSIDEAFSLYTKMAQHFPDDYVAYFFLGRIHAMKNNTEYAEKAFKKSISLNPDLIEPRFELISIYQSDQEDENQTIASPRVIQIYEEILAMDPQNIRASLELPLYLYRTGQTDAAQAKLAAFGKKHRHDPGPFMLAAKEFIGNKRYKDAVIIFTGLLKGAPDNSSLHYMVGLSWDALQEINKAISHFMKIKPESEHYKKSIIHIAYLYNENEKPEKALAFLLKKHRELPNDSEIISYIATLYEDQKAYEKAIEMLDKGLLLYPENSDMLFRYGIVQDKWGNKDKCIKTMQQLIELEPENATALNYLGYTYADLGIELDLAETLIKKAMALTPDDGYITDSLGWVYYQKGDYLRAIEYLERAIELSEYDPVIAEHLGDAYQKANMPQKALEIYKKALEKAGDNKKELINKIKTVELSLHAQP
ncbi:tetratricopeptide repeat protein [Desulfocicer vacuolatum]|nr:tetratricopeptide repeat protein [Desulfocicer vacuolatum]